MIVFGCIYIIYKYKGKAVPSQACSGPGGSSFPYFMTKAQDCGKVVSLTHRPHLPPENTPCTPIRGSVDPKAIVFYDNENFQ